MQTTAVAPDVALKAKLYRGLADPSRLAILEVLRRGDRNVGDLVGVTGLGQSNVSNHLACLHDCGLVAREARGRYVFYRLSDRRVADLLALGEGLLSDVAAGVDACARYRVGDEETPSGDVGRGAG